MKLGREVTNWRDLAFDKYQLSQWNVGDYIPLPGYGMFVIDEIKKEYIKILAFDEQESLVRTYKLDNYDDRIKSLINRFGAFIFDSRGYPVRECFVNHYEIIKDNCRG